MAPTCPDTLACPGFDSHKDPFIIDQPAHVYFCGGQNKFGYRYLKDYNTVLLTIPDLRKHATLILVNVEDPKDIIMHSFEDPKP